jgi:uncharacterized membrane protein
MPELDAVRERLAINVPTAERAGSIGLGAALALYGLSRRSLGGTLLALAGGSLIFRGATGHCALYRKLGINSGRLNTDTGVPGNRGIKTEQSIEINKSPAEAYHFWRQLENLPRFMDHVETVERIDDKRSRWVVRGPLGARLEWQAEIINEHSDRMIAWESLPGSEVRNAGSVWFEPSENGGTRVKVALQYQPPAGVVGASVAELLGEAPDQQLANDLRRFKEVIEGSDSAR